MDHVLTIQGKIGELDATVSQTTTLIKQGILPAHCTDPLKALQAELIKMKDNAEEMYSSLNVNSEFPTLTGVSLTLVKKLFLLRELKASVQKRASHACFEFDKLDRAAGGKDMVLGLSSRSSLGFLLLNTYFLRNQDASVRSSSNVQEEPNPHQLCNAIQRGMHIDTSRVARRLPNTQTGTSPNVAHRAQGMHNLDGVSLGFEGGE